MKKLAAVGIIILILLAAVSGLVDEEQNSQASAQPGEVSREEIEDLFRHAIRDKYSENKPYSVFASKTTDGRWVLEARYQKSFGVLKVKYEDRESWTGLEYQFVPIDSAWL